MGLKNLVFRKSYRTCPPKKAVLITRIEGCGKRNLIGIKYISDFFKSKKFRFEIVPISKSNSSSIQAKVFNSFGIIIAPWSSQLTNLLFAQKQSVSVIITPFCLENVFPKLSNISDLHTILSLGHKSSGYDYDKKSCLKSTVFYENDCYNTWQRMLRNHDTIIEKEIIEKDLQKAISFIQSCYNSI